MDEKEYQWLKQRKSGIGGSEASIVLGVNPWRSRLELWNDKINPVIQTTETVDLNFKWGKILEPVIINEYKNITGRKVITGVEQFTSEQYPFMNANLDGIVIDKKKGIGVLEAKTKGAFVNWNENIPLYYMIQMQHYLAVTGFKYASFTVLDFAKKDLLWYDVDRDENLISKIIDEEKKFWDLVLNKTPPTVDGSKSCNEYLRNKYADSVEGKKIDLTQNQIASKSADVLKYIRSEKKALESDELKNKNILMSIMEDAEIGIGINYKITWKNDKDSFEFDEETFKVKHPELYKQFLKDKKGVRRFTIKFNE